MRGFVGILTLVSSIVCGTAALAATTNGFEPVGAWSASAACRSGAAFSTRGSGTGLEKAVRYDGKPKSSKIIVKVAGDMVEVTDGDAVYNYRIIGPNKLLYLGVTKLSDGAEAGVAPYAGRRCGG